MSHDVFICHSSEDRVIANAACVRLEAAGIRCWIAPRDPIPGIPYGRQLVDAVEAARLVLLIFSAHADASEHVLREMELASESGKIVIPFRVENVLPTGDLKYYIRRVHWLDAMTPPMEGRIDELVALVRRIIAAPATAEDLAPPTAPPPPAPPLRDEVPPPPKAPPEPQSHDKPDVPPRRSATPVALLSLGGAAVLAFAVWAWAAGHSSVPPAPTPTQPPRTQSAVASSNGTTKTAAQVESADVVRDYYRLWNLSEFKKMYSMLSIRMQRTIPYNKYVEYHSLVTQIEADVTPGNSPNVVNFHIVSHDREKDGRISESVNAGQWYLTTENGNLKLDRQVAREIKSTAATTAPAVATPVPIVAATQEPIAATAAPALPSSVDFVTNYYRLWNLGDYSTMYGQLSARMQRKNPYTQYVKYHSLVTQIQVDATPTNNPMIVDVRIVSHDREKNGTITQAVNVGQWYLTVENGELKLDDEIVHEVK